VNVFLMATVIGTGIALAALIWMLYLRLQASIEAIDDRVAHLIAGISLLTDTTEGGLRDVAVEIGRQATPAPVAKPRPRATTQRRIAGAARRGRTVQDIAVSEQMSEGEVRLHLNIDKARTKERAHASMR
jgi:DNA-binding NarL/FixJ family response regulator